VWIRPATGSRQKKERVPHETRPFPLWQQNYSPHCAVGDVAAVRVNVAIGEPEIVGAVEEASTVTVSPLWSIVITISVTGEVCAW